MSRFFAAVALIAGLAPFASAQVAVASPAAPKPPLEAQMACHYSMGGRIEKGQAVLAGKMGGSQGRFVFNAHTYSFQSADGASSGAAVLMALNAALVDQARAVESIDPGSFGMSRCPELIPAPAPTDY